MTRKRADVQPRMLRLTCYKIGKLTPARLAPGKLKRVLASRDELLVALDRITKCASMKGPHGTTVYFISDEYMKAGRDAVAKAYKLNG